MTQIKAIEKAAHSDIKVSHDFTYAHVKANHIIPLILHEMVPASQSFPILFVKDQNAEQFRVVALTGLRPGENLFAGEEHWGGNYVPAQVRSYPFVLVKNPNNEDEAVLCIDEDSTLIDKGNGEGLFGEDGEQSEFLKRRFQEIVDIAKRVQMTENFVKELEAKDLLVQKKLTLKVPGEEPYELTGFYVVDEEKFNQLSDEDFLDMRKKGILPGVYAALMSSVRIQSLIHKKHTAA